MMIGGRVESSSIAFKRRRAQTIESHDLLANRAANWVDTRANGVIVNEHGACTALPQPAPEPGIVESKSVSKHIKKGALGINIEEVDFAVHLY
jgi:hypothetical protein